MPASTSACCAPSRVATRPRTSASANAPSAAAPSTATAAPARAAAPIKTPASAAYDAEYGDLVVVRYTLGGDRTGVEYVDGVPSEPPTGDPLGARGGVRSPGLNVGKHTSIVANAAGLARVAYYDVSGNALKVAVEGPRQVWSSHTIDSAAVATLGQVGTFTDMAILDNGTLLVSYLSHLSPINGVTDPASGLKLARSRTPNPTSAADWEVLTNSVLDGDGLGGRVSGDVGRFPAIGTIAGDLVVTYEDFTRHTLRVWRGPAATPGVGGIYGIADQLREPTRSGARFVGADLRMATFEGNSFAATTILSDGANGFYSDVAVAGNKVYICSVVAELDSRGKERSRLRLDIQTLP